VDKSVNTNIGGMGNILNVSEYMSNVTNQVNNNLQQTSASDDAKALVQQLTEQIKAISNQSDPALIQKMGKDLKKLSEEMVDQQPNEEYFRVSLKGIREAAEAVGAIAKPIINTVLKLMPLLGV